MNSIKIKLLLILIISIFVTGCLGDRVRVGTGEVGKVVGTSGVEDSIRKTSTFRLGVCYTSACPYLVKLQTTKSMQKMTIDQVFITKSKVDLDDVEVGIQFRVRPDADSINLVFEEIRPDDNKIITSEQLWN